MKLKKIQLHYFRNYTNKVFEFDDVGAIIIGPNGSGKTNLFEAIVYNSIGKSFRYHSDNIVSQHNMKSFIILAEFTLKTGNCKISTEYTQNKKRMFINNNPVTKLSHVYEFIKVVYCSPEDVILVNGSPQKRRQYFDLAIAQKMPEYISKLKHYNHIVDQRNNLLKNQNNITQKKQWDHLLLDAALPIMKERIDYINELNKKINTMYENKINEARHLKLVYKPTLNPYYSISKSESYRTILDKNDKKEWLYQRTIIGPHLDDYDILLGEYLIKEVGSQGQKRTATLLIKIAHLEMIKDVIGEYPILLLDDIFAELDKKHIEQFMEVLKKHEQIFISSPNQSIKKYWKGYPILKFAG